MTKRTSNRTPAGAAKQQHQHALTAPDRQPSLMLSVPSQARGLAAQQAACALHKQPLWRASWPRRLRPRSVQLFGRPPAAFIWQQDCNTTLPSWSQARDSVLLTVSRPPPSAFAMRAASTTACGSKTCSNQLRRGLCACEQGDEQVCSGTCLEAELAGERSGKR